MPHVREREPFELRRKLAGIQLQIGERPGMYKPNKATGEGGLLMPA